MQIKIRHHGWRRVLASTAAVVLLSQVHVLGAAQAKADELSAATLGNGSSTTASLQTGPDMLGASLPQPLDAINADRYRQIFRLQAAGDFTSSDRLISDLNDPVLLGHVLADRYLAPGYKAKPKELADWLKNYSALPEADSIYTLAARKGVKKAALTKPKFDITRVGSPDENSADNDPNWQAGLNAWRVRNYNAAATFFEKAAIRTSSSQWDRAAAAYWASRAHVRAKNPDKVSHWLKVAAEFPRTFYGQLATRALGLEPSFDWRVPTLMSNHGALLMSSRIGKRALALLQVGEMDLAEKELLILQSESKVDVSDALVAISQAYRLPSLALKIGAWRSLKGGARMDAALYPLPSWQPANGFTVDQALLFAVMRQESGFNPNAVSGAGAVGLMQLMPGTAKAIGAPTGVKLKDPLTSLAYGQKYIQRLLDDSSVKGDLFMMAAAYNAGPGNLAKWKKSIRGSEDPLLFIESLPSRETRNFVERVMGAYWVYQARLGQPARSLESVANGAWPTYQRGGNIAAAAN
ncbi:lytic transglycosylase domain-containing protein [Dongia sp.]|uniref:lytic transglycosylase domain-containing protein n=1 Tax=Dongia sp. TaxID=1977262 RepID=UPI0035B38F95